MFSDIQSCFGLKPLSLGVPIVAQQVTNLTSIHEDVGSIPGLVHWVKDPVLPQPVMWVTDVVRFWCCCGCSVGQQLQL